MRDADVLIERAESAMDEGDWDSAIHAYEQAVQRSSPSEATLANLHGCRNQLIIRQSAQLVDRYPDDFDVAYAHTCVLRGTGRSREAAALCTALIERFGGQRGIKLRLQRLDAAVQAGDGTWLSEDVCELVSASRGQPWATRFVLTTITGISDRSLLAALSALLEIEVIRTSIPLTTAITRKLEALELLAALD